MDVMMPKKSGYTLCAHIKSNPDTKNIPVVIVTGLDTEINKEIGVNMGADGYLVKPAQPNELQNTISRLLMFKHQTAKC
jgi:DNA-binding response OmpR family regulator